MERKIKEVPTKVASIDNKYTKEQIKQFQQEQKRVIYRRRRLAVIFTVAIVFFVISSLNLIKSSQQISQLQKEKATVTAEQAELTDKIAGLEYEVQLLGNQEYLQKLARQQYYYTKDGELIYNIPALNQNNTKDSKKVEADEEKTSSTK